MLRPSYSELMMQINSEKHADTRITSRYTIVLAAAKRAREIIDGNPALTNIIVDKPVSIAVKELNEGKLIITSSTGSPKSSKNENDYVEEKTID